MADNNLNQVFTSTNFDPKFAVGRLFPTYQLEFKDGRSELRLDYLGPRLIRILKRIKIFTPYVYHGFEVFTTLVYQAYGTTTPTALVLMYNGIAHPLELIKGQTIKFPDLAPIRQFIESQNNVNNVGKTITI